MYLKKYLLNQIDGETIDAQKRANETSTVVDNLQSKLNKLQRKFLKNDFDAKEIKSQADNVKDSASNAHEQATKVIIKCLIHHFMEI